MNDNNLSYISLNIKKIKLTTVYKYVSGSMIKYGSCSMTTRAEKGTKIRLVSGPKIEEVDINIIFSDQLDDSCDINSSLFKNDAGIICIDNMNNVSGYIKMNNFDDFKEILNADFAGKMRLALPDIPVSFDSSDAWYLWGDRNSYGNKLPLKLRISQLEFEISINQEK